MVFKSRGYDYLYILSNDFSPSEMVTITRSKLPPDSFIQDLKKSESSSPWILSRPTEVLFSQSYEQCENIEMRIHEFLISRGFCGGAPKDYQVSFSDALILLEGAVLNKNLYRDEVFTGIEHTEVFPEEGCNYHMLGHLFNGTYYKARQLSRDIFENNKRIAYQCFKRGAFLGDEKCLFDMGICLEHGMGVIPNIPLAIDYYTQIFASQPSKAVNGLFRCYLRQENVVKALATLEGFLGYCDQNIDHNHTRLCDSDQVDFEKDIVQKILQGHKVYVRVLANFLIDCRKFTGDWQLIEAHRQVFSEFAFSIKNYLKAEYDFYHQHKFDHLASNVDDCLKNLDSFIQLQDKKAG